VVLEQRTRASGVDAAEIEEDVRARLVNALPAADRPRASRLIGARRHLRAAGRAFAAEDFNSATREFVAAGRAAPWLVTSPVWGPQLALSTAKAAVAAALPGRAGVHARRAVKEVRTRLRHNPVEPGVTPIGREDR